MMFLNLLYSDKDIYHMLCNGVENVHYKKIADNTIEISADSKYNPGTDWEFANSFNGFLRKGDPADKMEKLKVASKEAVTSPLMGFIFDSKPVNSETAQITAVYEELGVGLTNGSLDFDTYYPKFIDKLKKAGIDKYIAEMQKQVNEWKAANGK